MEGEGITGKREYWGDLVGATGEMLCAKSDRRDVQCIHLP